MGLNQNSSQLDIDHKHPYIIIKKTRRVAAMHVLSLFYWMLTKRELQGLRGDCHPYGPNLK